MTVSSSKTPSKIRRIAPTVLLSLYHSFTLYLALPLCIIFTSLAFQKSYLYESCITGALVSLSFLGYETGSSQPPHARLTSGLEEDVSHKIYVNIAGCTQEYDKLDKIVLIAV